MTDFFPQHFKYVIPLSNGCHGSWWKICCHSFLSFSVQNVSFISGCFKVGSLSGFFRKFAYNVSFCGFFLMVLLLRTHWTSWTCGFLVFISWKLFQALWFQMLFLCPCISPTFFGIFSSVYSFLIVSVAMPSKSLIFFSSVSNLLSNW